MVQNIPLESQVVSTPTKVDKAFRLATRMLFAVAFIGQMTFVFYIVSFYGGIVVSGAYEKVNETLGHGIIAGDGIGNFMLAIHIALAAVIILGGPMQFLPFIRNRFPVFHRWNGRIYFTTALVVSLAGLYMNATRGAHGGLPLALGNGLNAALIFGFSLMAWRTARQRNFAAHKKWALRAFLMVSGVWFFRIGYGLWLLLTGFKGYGMGEYLNGPFDIFLGFGHSLVPLMLVELYFFAKSHTNTRVKIGGTIGLGILTVLLAAGIVVAGMVFWFR